MPKEETKTAPAPAPQSQAEPPRPASISPADSLSRVDNFTNGVAERLSVFANQYGPIVLTDSQRTDLLADIERLRGMGKDPHNPTAEPPHNPPASPAFIPASSTVPQPGPAPNNDTRLAEASTAGVTVPSPIVTNK